MPSDGLLIRADAGISVGLGHAIRCMALAQSWQDAGGFVVYAMRDGGDIFAERLSAQGMKLLKLTEQVGSREDALATVRIASKLGIEWVVLDGYQFEAGFQQILKTAGLRLLCIDDEAKVGHFHADIVLNQNPHACEADYRNREPHTCLLLGPQYALLRREFQVWRDWQGEVPHVAKNVLIMMGGSDQGNVTLAVLRALENLSHLGIGVTIAVGDANPHLRSIRAAAHESRVPVTVEHAVVDIPRLLSSTDLAVSASGSSCYELAFMRVPSIVLALAENQRKVAEYLHDLGAVSNWPAEDILNAKALGEHIASVAVNRNQRKRMAAVGRSVVDGGGCDRVVKVMKDRRPAIAKKFLFRKATLQDRTWLWRVANDQEARAASLSREPIPYEKHIVWFESVLSDKHRLLLIVNGYKDQVLGYVRFDFNDDIATMSINLEKSFRGLGLATPIIEEACGAMFDQTAVRQVVAYVKTENKASFSAFARASFVTCRGVNIQDQSCLMLVLQRKGA